MKPGTRLFWTYKPSGDWLFDEVGKVIVWRTGRPEVHEAISPDGANVFESTVWFEKRKILGLFSVPWPHGGVRWHEKADWDYAMEPIVDVPLVVVTAMKSYVADQIDRHRPYNILELIAMLWVWPLRNLYRRFGWRIPFSSAMLGEFCSVFAEKVWLAGWSTVPLSDEDFAPPGEVAQSPVLRRTT